MGMKVICICFFTIVFKMWISLCCMGWPGIHDLPTLTTQVSGITGSYIQPNLYNISSAPEFYSEQSRVKCGVSYIPY